MSAPLFALVKTRRVRRLLQERDGGIIVQRERAWGLALKQQHRRRQRGCEGCCSSGRLVEFQFSRARTPLCTGMRGRGAPAPSKFKFRNLPISEREALLSPPLSAYSRNERVFGSCCRTRSSATPIARRASRPELSIHPFGHTSLDLRVFSTAVNGMLSFSPLSPFLSLSGRCHDGNQQASEVAARRT